jgi:chemotaxis protein CheZ
MPTGRASTRSAKRPRKAVQKGRDSRAKASRLAAKRKSAAKGKVKVVEIARKVRRILKERRVAATPADERLFAELADLARYIRQARAEIAALRPDDVKAEYIPSATDELDAIVQATEAATNTIMDAVESIEATVGELPAEAADAIGAATTRIYEACTFQDITGQRINKVVKALKHIEEKVEGLAVAFGGFKGRRRPSGGSKEKKIVTEQDLLAGPQLPDQAKKQAEIDALFSG